MFLRVKEAKYVPRYQVEIRFNDGTHRVVDFGPFLKQARNPMFTKYRRLKEFKSFHIQDGDLMWGDYEMIFPIEDLHHGSIIKGGETGSSHFILNESSTLTRALSEEKTEAASYKKPKRNKAW